MQLGDIANELTWSKSRHGKLAECPRAYWYQYYGSWGGWSETAPREVREAYVLKNLSTRAQWAGHAVHDAVRWALTAARMGQAPPRGPIVERMRQKMRDDFRRSRAGEYRQSPKSGGLVEHEYREPVSDAEWKATWEHAERCLAAFFETRWPSKAATLPSRDWLPIDEIGSFFLDGVKVWAGPDFAYREGREVVLVDWKTGTPREEDRDQVKGYALYAQARWGARTDTVTLRLVYLADQAEIAVGADEPSLASFRAFFRESVALMRGKVRDLETNTALRDDFARTDDLATCASCAFRRPCGREEAVRERQQAGATPSAPPEGRAER